MIFGIHGSESNWMDLIMTGNDNINYNHNNDDIVQNKIHYNENNKFTMTVYNEFYKMLFYQWSVNGINTLVLLV